MKVKSKIGDIEITAISDGEASSVSYLWPFPDVPIHSWDEYPEALDARNQHTSNFGAFVIQTKEDVILVDTGLGPNPPSRFGEPPCLLPTEIGNSGIQVEDVSTVFFTHLHFDHIGWALNINGRAPFFPKARYLVSQDEFSYWKTCKDSNKSDHLEAFKKFIEPLDSLDLLDVFDGETELVPGVRTFPTPGHTPGHTSLLLESNGINGMVTGDVFHSAAQFTNPDWSHRADVDPEQGCSTRKALLSQLVPGVIIAAGHLEHGFNIGTIAVIKNKRYWQVI